MALPAIVASIDALPESVRAHYSPISDGEHKGKFMLGVEEHAGYKLDNVAPLRSAHEHEKEARRQANERLKAFGDLTPESARDLQSQIDKLKGGVPKEQLQAMLDSEVARLKQSWDGERKGLEGKASKFDRMLRKALIDGTAADALAKAGAKPSGIKLLVNELRTMADVEIPDSDDAPPRVYLKNEAGGRRTTHRSGQNGDMTIEEWANDFARKDYPDLFDAGGASGGGRNGSSNRNGVGGAFTMTADQAKANPAAFYAMEDEAKKAGQRVTVTP